MSSVKIPFVFLRFLAFMNMDTGTSKYLLVFKILQTLGEMVRTFNLFWLCWHQQVFFDCSWKHILVTCFLTAIISATSQPTFTCYKFNNRNNRTKHELCSELTIKTPEQCHWRCCGVFIVNFQHISHLVLVFLLLTWSRLMLAALVVVLVNYHQ